MKFIRSSKFALFLTAVSATILAVLFFATNPQSARLLGVLVVIVALYGVFLGVILLIGNLIAYRRTKKHSISSRENNNHRLEISAVLALAPVLTIILNSLGTIGIIEIILVIGFEVVVIFLIRKKR
jgi:tellurite resistance protein TehA-like permease